MRSIAGSAVASPLGNGSLTWMVPKNLVYGSNYRIRMTSDSNTSCTAISDKFFTVTGPALDVTAPDGGESWPKGSPQTIAWSFTGNPGGNVKIQLLKGGVPVRTITMATPVGTGGAGSYPWTIATDLDTWSDYRIKITHTVIKGCAGTSGADFGIANAGLIAAAGPDQRVAEAAEVRLSGTNSKGLEKDTVSFLWSQLDGPQTKLSSPAAVEPSFTAPEAGADGQSLTFQLTLTDQLGSQSQDSCIVNVTVANMPPTADAGPNQTVGNGEWVELDGSASFDLDDGIAGYQWRQLAGPPVNLSDPDAAQTSFPAPSSDTGVEELVFQLLVTDAEGLQDKQKVVVRVTEASPTVPGKSE